MFKMGNYGFGFRPSSRKGEHPGRLYFRVAHGGVSRSVTMPYRVWPREWDSSRRWLATPCVCHGDGCYGFNYGSDGTVARRRGNCLNDRTGFDDSGGDRHRRLSDYEIAMSHDMRRMAGIVEKLELGGRYTVDDMMSLFRSATGGNTLGACARTQARSMERGGQWRTARACRTAAARFVGFNGGRDVKIENVTAALLGEFQRTLRSEGRSMNTVSFYMRTLRAVYNRAVAEGSVPHRAENPFARVYTGVSPTRKRALSADELTRLSTFDPTATVAGRAGPEHSGKEIDTDIKSKPHELPDHLQRSLAMFLFCFHARGMCFTDMAHLKKSDLRGGTILYRRRKTGQSIEMEILPAMRRIIEWFAPMTVGSLYLFPVITDSDKAHRLQYESGLRLQNRRLKSIAAIAGVDERLSTHVARHSWASTAKRAGLPLAVICEGLGHSDPKTTGIYLARLERSVLDSASRVVSETISHGYCGEAHEKGCIPDGRFGPPLPGNAFRYGHFGAW